MDKRALIQSVISQLEAELALQTAAAHGSRAEATDEESRAEDKYDMRSQSAAYLAQGQARMATEIMAAIRAWKNLVVKPFGPGDAAAAGALVTLESRAGRASYLLGPHSGGREARDGAEVATVVTAASPLGRQLYGRRQGETVELGDRQGPRLHRIAAVV
jgi:transcription elongation GreA/GreB family factor